MARDWKPRQAPAKTSLTEIARRYHAAAVALSQTLGLPVQEVLAQHRESVTAIFIESGRCELRLPAGVTLPPLAAPSPNGHQPPSDESITRASNTCAPGDPAPLMAEVETDVPDFAPPTGEAPPTTIPAGLPCAGQRITQLSPARLRMLLSKVA